VFHLRYVVFAAQKVVLLFHQHNTVKHSGTRLRDFVELFPTLAKVPIVRKRYGCFPWQYHSNLKAASNSTFP
jgi:hypothetical protein